MFDIVLEKTHKAIFRLHSLLTFIASDPLKKYYSVLYYTIVLYYKNAD